MHHIDYSHNKPASIKFFNSSQDLKNGKYTDVPIAEAEQIMAKQRNIPTFTWLENFDDEFSSFAGDLIDTNKMGLCNFGQEVGYGAVAAQNIKKGEMLVFAGEIVDVNSVTEKGNVYISSILNQPNMLINAKSKGGFSSMLLDLPDEKTVKKIQTKFHCQDGVAQANFKSIYKKNFLILKALRDIQSGEILGFSYTLHCRLFYPCFIVFDRTGEQLSNEIIEYTNRGIFLEYLFLSISEIDNILLVKILLLLKNNKLNHKKIFNYLHRFPLNLKELNNEELLWLKIFIPDSWEFYFIKDKINIELSNIKKEERFYKRREFCESLIHSAEQQFRMRKYIKADFYSYSKIIGCSIHIPYPGIEEDYLIISEYYSSIDKNSPCIHFFNEYLVTLQLRKNLAKLLNHIIKYLNIYIKSHNEIFQQIVNHKIEELIEIANIIYSLVGKKIYSIDMLQGIPFISEIDLPASPYRTRELCISKINDIIRQMKCFLHHCEIEHDEISLEKLLLTAFSSIEKVISENYIHAMIFALTPFGQLPTSIIMLIINHLANSKEITALVALNLTCKSFSDKINHNEELWRKIIQMILPDHDSEKQIKKLIGGNYFYSMRAKNTFCLFHYDRDLSVTTGKNIIYNPLHILNENKEEIGREHYPITVFGKKDYSRRVKNYNSSFLVKFSLPFLKALKLVRKGKFEKLKNHAIVILPAENSLRFRNKNKHLFSKNENNNYNQPIPIEYNGNIFIRKNS